jgi:diaminopimelate epimerase
MKTPYWRYSATGNTFLIFDNRTAGLHHFSSEIYQQWAEAQRVDGLLFLEKPHSLEDEHDFHMRYLNADGGEVEMCGNGARAMIHFAGQICQIKPIKELFIFSTKCGVYSGKASAPEGYPIHMSEVGEFDSMNVEGLYPRALNSSYLFTGVPHCCFEVEDLSQDDLMLYGREIRNNNLFDEGTNVNFYKVTSIKEIEMRTYERGVEAETQSCGTGATAVALCVARRLDWSGSVKVNVPGGELKVSFDKSFGNVFLSGGVDFLGEGHFNSVEREA